MSLPKRNRPAQHPIYEEGKRSSIVFVTVCAKDRRHLLANEIAHELLVSAWVESDHFVVGRYVVMPDHVHLFCAPARYDHLSLQRWVAYWKSIVSKKWPHSEDMPIWQNYLWDTQLRRGDSYSAKWAYVHENPVRAGFVANSEDWLWQGELNLLRWHD